MSEDKDQQHEVKEERYVEDLIEYYNTYVHAVINEIFVGISINLGLSEKQAYQIAKTDPKRLEKAFFKDVFNKFKNIFKYKIPKFRIKTNVGNTDQWDAIYQAIDQYWKQNTASVTEDMVIKGYILGRKTSKYRKQIDSKHEKQSLTEIIKNNPIPDKFSDAYKQYDFKNAEKNAMNRAFSNIAMHVADTGDGVKQAIRKTVTEGINEGKGKTEIASDLYWNVQKETGNETAESVRKNWTRISATEMNSVFEAGILAPFEADAMESIKTGKGVYFVRVGGTCDWCAPRQGSIVRLLPLSIITDTGNDSLSGLGIDDPYTDTAIWVGKNNVGYKKAEWRLCCPAHPYNRATFTPIDFDKQEYDSKLGRVVDRVPESLRRYGIKRDTSFADPEEIEKLKPKNIGNGLVRFNDNIYEAVNKEDFQRKNELYQRDRSLPLPIPKGTPQYRRIFEAAQ